MTNYIFISYDALSEFTSCKNLQSADYEEGELLAKVLKCETEEWTHSKLFLSRISDNGIIFHTSKINRKKGILFDFSTYKGFEGQSYSVVISIFQKINRYAIKYYNSLPLGPNEKNIDEKLALIYPFPFAAQKEVNKVYVDKNSSSQNRAEQNFLTIFYQGHNAQAQPSFTNLNKAVADLRNGNFSTIPSNVTSSIHSLSVTNLDVAPKEMTLDANIGLGVWMKFLTRPQLDFVNREVVGAERLEGAAGSGKTIALVLRCINILTKPTSLEEYHIIFLTHSIASKEKVLDSFFANCINAGDYLEKDGSRPKRSILITTLQEWSSQNLGTNSIEDSEFLDKDASDSKVYQLLFIQQAIEVVREKTWNGYSVLCSPEFVHFMETASRDSITELFRYEISVLIKGRSNCVLKKYKQLVRPQLCLPLKNENDLLFSFEVFQEYQSSLEFVGQFDSDDITLSALGQINTPIWKRRSAKDGYDVCFIDETQLFNFNELSVFHFLNKPNLSNRIVYAIDRSQTFGEVGFSDDELSQIIDKSNSYDSKLETIFRSSPENVDLAFNILASNSAIFHNFDNPLDKCSYSFTFEEESKCVSPRYLLYTSDDVMLDAVINEAETYHMNKNVERGNIAIISTSIELTKKIESRFSHSSKSVVLLKGKNDVKSRQTALNGHCFVLGDIDIIGGLEFDAVIIVGVDKGRVPPEGNDITAFSRYAWHNRMYVAVTRAKYAVTLLGNRNKGASLVLGSAIENNVINVENR